MSTNPIGKYINEYWKGNKLSRQERVAEAIKNVVSKMMDKVMVRVLEALILKDDLLHRLAEYGKN
jgi:ornithine carbamoyltransferase